MQRLMPRQATPALSVDTLDHGQWSLAEQSPQRFTLIVFYRGLHCPICKPYVRELDRQFTAFSELGVEAIVLSTDDAERARQSQQDWGIKQVPVGFGLSIESAREWGLYISSGRGKTSIGIEEPVLFNEPGLFLVSPDSTLYSASIQTMPFVRPRFEELLKALETIIGRDYPARGEA
ncbi:MAG: AhpC/TSA family protein [Gammaproteobacteria bacterium]|nr:AhpC/TSA family protein [Gammaproteobacteria bacterium]